MIVFQALVIAVYVMSTCKSVEQDEDEDFIKFRPTFDKTNEKLKVGLLPLLTLCNIYTLQTGYNTKYQQWPHHIELPNCQNVLES